MQCFRSARRFGAVDSNADFSTGFSRHGASRRLSRKFLSTSFSHTQASLPPFNSTTEKIKNNLVSSQSLNCQNFNASSQKRHVRNFQKAQACLSSWERDEEKTKTRSFQNDSKRTLGIRSKLSTCHTWTHSRRLVNIQLLNMTLHCTHLQHELSAAVSSAPSCLRNSYSQNTCTD